jgi:hypothetical protein
MECTGFDVADGALFDLPENFFSRTFSGEPREIATRGESDYGGRSCRSLFCRAPVFLSPAVPLP